MTTTSDPSLESLLTSLGFAAESRQTWTLWRLGPPPPAADGSARPARGHGTPKTANPWTVTELELAERKANLGVHRLRMALDQKVFVANLAALVRRYFTARAVANFVYEPEGSVWCLFEFTRPGSRERAGGNALTAAGVLVPQGIGGFNVRLMADGGFGSVILSDIFGCGYLPANFVSAPLRYVAEALALKPPHAVCGLELKGSSVNELRFRLTAPAILHLMQRGAQAPALAALAAVLAKARGSSSASVMAGASGFRVAVPDSEASEAAGLVDVAFAPVEVLESRERAERYRELDATLLSGKLGRALRAATDRLAQDPDSLYLMRRLALLGIAGKKERPSTFLARALELEPDNKLFLSYAVNLALEDGDSTAVLAHLSHLGGLLMGQVTGADALGCFDVVLPELLGDAWSGEDPQKAEDCYHRIIQRRGDLPRVLRKLIALARGAERTEQEGAYIGRLLGVERRHGELAKLLVRLAELRRVHATGRDEAVQLAQKALKLDRSHSGAALLAAELLVEKGRSEEAVQLLDSLLKDANLNLPSAAKSRLEEMVGRIWYRHLRRPDLAETRYEEALRHDQENVGALLELEAIYRAQPNLAALAGILELQFDVFARAGDGGTLTRIFDELVPLYRGTLAQPKRAYDLYQRLLAAAATSPLAVERVLDWRDVDIDWHDLYAKLSAALPQVPAGEKRGQFLCRLAEICREKLSDTAASLRHLREALDEGWIDGNGFLVLVETLSREKDFAALAHVYERRLTQVPAAEQRRLLVELLAMPNGLTEVRRDALALNAYVLDPAADRTVRQRFHAYQGLQDAPGIDRLLGTLLADPRIGAAQQTTWLRYAVEVLDGVVDDRRFGLLDGIFRRLLGAAEDRVATLQEAIAALKGTADGRLLVPYVAELLGAGLIPVLEERQVVKLLAGLDHELALYHQLMSFKATQPPVAAGHARTAAALYGKRANQELNTEKMLARLATLVPCSEVDLAELKGLVARTGNWLMLAKALQRQADFEDEPQRKYGLLEQLGVLYWKKLKDHARARLTFVLALRHAPEPHRLKLVLAAVAAEAGDSVQERKALVDFMTDAAAPLDPKAMTQATGRLLQLGESPEALQRLVLPRLDAAAGAGDFALAGRLAAVLLDNGVMSPELYKAAFKAALVAGDADRAVECWWRGLACVPNKSRAKTFMAETRKILDSEERRDLLLNCYKAALDNRIGDRLGPKIQHELMLSYGAMLFDADNKRRKALDVYQEVYAAEPEDNRTWMPLYFLLLEFGAPVERLVHLREILPKLDQDPRPLKAFPLTIESLAVELAELTQQLGADVPAEQRRVPAAAKAAPPRQPPPPPVFGAPRQHLAAADDDESKPDLAAGDGEELAEHEGDLVAPTALVAGESADFGMPPPRPPAPVARALSMVAPASAPMPATRGVAAGPAAATHAFKLGLLPSLAAAGGSPSGNPQGAAPTRAPAPAAALVPHSGVPDLSIHESAAASAASEPAEGAASEAADGAASEAADGAASGAANDAAPEAADGAAEAAGGDAEEPVAPFDFSPAAFAAAAPAASAEPDAHIFVLNATDNEPWYQSAVDAAERRKAAGDAAAALPEPLPDSLHLASLAPGGAYASASAATDGTLAGDGHGMQPEFDLGLPAAPHPPATFDLGGVFAAADAGRLPATSEAAGRVDGLPSGAATSAGSVLFDLGGAPTTGLAAAPLDAGAWLPLGGVGLAPAPASGEAAAPDLGAWLPPGGAGFTPEFGLGEGLAMGLGAPLPATDAGAAGIALPPDLGGAMPVGPFETLADPGNFSIDAGDSGLPVLPAPHGAPEAAVARAAPPGELGGLFALGALDGASQNSGVELAAVAETQAPHSGPNLAPPAPPPSREDLSITDALPSSPQAMGYAGSGSEAPRFSGTQSSQTSALGTSAGEGTNVVSSGEVAYGGASDSGDDVSDWRAAAIKGDFNADLTDALLKQAFASELEKHLAIQCVSLVAGNCDRLSNWHWRVWRDPKEYGYPLNGKDRYPASSSPPALHSTLHKFVLTAAPLLVRRFRSRFTLEHVARRLEMNPGAIEKLRKPMNWGEGLLKDAGFHLYAERINERRHVAFNLPGLGREIFYDGVSRALYLDEAYYRKAPPSHLFHRVLGILWSVRIHYFVPMALHPVKEFVPLLAELTQFFGSGGLSLIRSRLTGGLAIAKHLSGMDTRLLKSLHAKIGTPSDEQVTQLWDAMRMHIYRLQIAETLDVIGVFESVLDRDLLKKQALKHSEIYKLAPGAKALMEFVTKLKI